MRKQKESGAALVLAIVIACVAAIAWQHRLSLSQLFLAQHVLQRSTAAASLAASQHHARLLNAHAFLNRTVMAHQVAMAHLLTIASAEKMRREMSIRFARFNPPIHLIAMMFGPHHAAAYAASKLSVAGSTLTGVHQLHAAFREHDHVLSGALKHARHTLLSNVVRDTEAIVKAVLDRNMSSQLHSSPKLDIKVQMPTRALGIQTIDPTDSIWRSWFDQTIKQHRYLQKRSDTAISWWVVDPKCPHLRHNLRRRGDSTFEVDGLWQATDTLSFHALRGIKIVLCYWREYPMGFANMKNIRARSASKSFVDDALANAGEFPDDFRKITFFRWFTSQFALTAMFHGFANVLADGWGYKTQIRWHARSQIQPYVLRPGQDLRTVVTVSQSLETLDDPLLRIGLRIKGLLSVQSDWGKALTARSAAQAYYDRYTPRPDGKSELENLFQPFWMAKNVLLR
ncbi:MAG: hypothetical protein LRY53_09115 [Burkholderiaceae bacterium]|nr:hypothetical protein [Burkholderiaceae bacterium]